MNFCKIQCQIFSLDSDKEKTLCHTPETNLVKSEDGNLGILFTRISVYYCCDTDKKDSSGQESICM